MSLSASTISKIADALKPEIINHIYENEKFAECMQELVSDALTSVMGEMDEDLYFDLGMTLFDRITLK